ncbi:hypothetical protein Krad_2357 [Kineococcus radiotolerans SRS30216 = ATCC BAA-149]|uniref:Uncharacterized protein n=1 Tax=Kineococcus radiotolerans (strain ATCC BAA-149 / DSM 14245 / SRS30216) TaxID=266940 RepID=A6WAJ8_KINRD|nr:hypothetical protein Krad_2357 [Kineococcus radiotolerans SRS30216 = ATCC BAA-149]
MREHRDMAASGPGGQAPRKLRAGDRVRLRTVDEERRLNGLTTDAVGVIDMELAVGGCLVGFPDAGLNVFGQDELDLVE